jgi:hypothetical protein
VHANDLFVYNGRERKAVEAVCKGLPQLDVVPSFALVVKSIDSVDGCAFVVSSQQKEVFGILNFIRKQQTDAL